MEIETGVSRMMQLAVSEGWQMRSTRRRLSTALTVAAVTLVAMWLASAVLAVEMPDNHDLSDISTGFIRLLLTGAAGLVAGCSAWLILRTLHRRNV
jgi:hypothetical protein